MKNYIWVLLCGVTGLVGYWLGRKSNEKRMREELQKEVHDLKAYYRKGLEKKEKEYREQLSEAGFIFGKKDVDLRDRSSMHPGIIPEYDPPGDPLVDQTPGGQQHRMVANMQERNSIAKRYQEQDFKDMDEDQESDDEEEEDLYSEEELILNHPYVISAEEYHEEKNWYDKEEFDFYQKDAALVNDHEEIILNWEDEIGEDALAILLTIEPKDVHEVYVRNDQESTDYLITVKPGSASELGFVPIGREG